MSWGSVYSLLHGGGATVGVGGRLVVDAGAALRLAHDVANGMAYLHSLGRDRDAVLPTFHLNSKHVMVSLRVFLHK